MKSEYGTGEIVLLQTLDYFRKKVEALEGETYRADELNFCYDSLHEDYVKKCSEYTSLENSYNKLAEVAEAEIAELKAENAKLKQALDMRMTECDKLKGEIRSLKNQINFEKEYETIWIDPNDTKITNIACGDNKATTPISSEEADALAYMAGWEKAGY